MWLQFTEAELSELQELEERYEQRMNKALERIKPFTGGYPGETLIEQYQSYVEGLDDDSRKARQEYVDILDELTRERTKLFLKFRPDIFGGIGNTAEIIESIVARTTTPEEMVFSTAKLTNEFFKGDIRPGHGKQVNVQKTDMAKKSPVFTYVWIPVEEMKENGMIDAWRDFSQYDQEVLEAVTTLYVEGNEYITDSMVYDLMTGNPGVKLSKNQKEEINATFTKLMYTPIRIDATQETKMGWTSFKYDAPILPAERVTANINGVEVPCIHPFRIPPFYAYSSTKKQIGRIPISLLKTPIKKNSEVIALQSYLYRKILKMKKNPKQKRAIRYDPIFECLGIEAKSNGALRKKTMKVRNNIRTILDFWKQKGFINGYSEYYGEKGKHIGVKIMLKA